VSGCDINCSPFDPKSNPKSSMCLDCMKFGQCLDITLLVLRPVYNKVMLFTQFCTPMVFSTEAHSVRHWICDREVMSSSLSREPSSIILYQPNGWEVNIHSTWCTSPVSLVSQCKLVSGWSLLKQRSVSLFGPCSLGKTTFFNETLACASVTV